MLESFPLLNLPKANLKLQRIKNDVYVWDVFRKKKLLLTPEEWVRQHVLHYLVSELNFPASLLALEHTITVNKLKRRCDVVVFAKDGFPKLIIECKAPHITLSEKAFMQIAQYNFKLQVQFLVLTNGISHVIAFIDKANNQISYWDRFPFYEDLS